jgi:hypothetical protein
VFGLFLDLGFDVFHLSLGCARLGHRALVTGKPSLVAPLITCAAAGRDDGNEAARARSPSQPLRLFFALWLVGFLERLRRRTDRGATGSLGSLFASHAGRAAELLDHG